VISVEVRARQDDWELLSRTLFPGDNDEHGAALLCGWVQTTGGQRLLVREVVPAVDGIDYVPGTRGYRHLTGEFVTRQLRKARDLGLVYLAVHNHGGDGYVAFSDPDLLSHERAYPTLLSVSGNPVGALVLSRDAVAGDIWLPDGTREEVATTSVIGEGLRRLTPSSISPASSVDHWGAVQPVYGRQSLMFGAAGQHLLGALRVGVVGAGGVGMLIIQALARLGVGEFVIIDPDVVSLSNLSRLPEALLRDASGRFGNGTLGRVLRRFGFGKPISKVDLAQRIITHANPYARVTSLAADVANDSVAKELRSCDFIFLAADTMLSRDVVNQVAYQFLVPTLQVGSKVLINKSTGVVEDVYAVVRSLGTARGCMRCNGLVNVSKLTEETLGSDEQRRNQRYVDDPEVVAPSVITLNAMGVGWAVNDFMQYATGIGRPATGFRVLRSNPVGVNGQQLTLQTPHVDPDCHVCGKNPYSALARGDSIELPTRLDGSGDSL
jgi:ThiF family